MAVNGWQEAGAAKRDAVNALIPSSWRLTEIPTAEKQRDITGTYLHKFLDPQEIEITETPAEGILERTTTGTWSAEAVARAFAHRAALVHQHVSCLHEIFFDAAFQDAKELDRYFAEHKKPKGALHGLPVSLKDQFHVKDVETSMGYIGWLGTFEGKKGTGKEKVYESEMVRELRELGAVLYCKTSVPHTLMSAETTNNIIGYTWSSKNRLLTSGGSSGGEGTLICGKGSPLGFGTDIGGSIRIPAGCNGIFGIRPSSGRLPYEGMANSMDGQNSILSVVGPLSNSVGGLRLAFKALLSQQPWLYDPLVNEMPWREDQHRITVDASKAAPSALSFGIMWDDGGIRPFPPVKRALEQVVESLRKQGHKVIDWTPPSHVEGCGIAGKVWDFDGGADCMAAFALSGEPAHKQSKVGHELLPQANGEQIAANNVAQRQYKKRYMDYWNSTAQLTGTGKPVDAVICAMSPFPSVRPFGYTYVNYTMIWNVLDYTAAVVPVTQVDKKVDAVFAGYQPLNEEDKKMMQEYDPEVYDGTRVTVQVVGRRLQEEKVLALSDYIYDLSGMKI